MKYFIYIFSILILLGINLGLFGYLPFYDQVPNLLLLLLIFYAIEKKNFDFFFIAFFSGVLLDFFSASFFGGFTLAFLVMAAIENLLSRIFIVFELNWKSLAILLFGSQIMFNIFLWLYYFCSYKLGWTPESPDLAVYLRGFLFSYIYNLILAYPVYLYYLYTKRAIDNLTLIRRGVVK